MEVPKEILVVPLKEKKPIIKNKKKALKVLGSGISLISFLIYVYYYPAPNEFTFQNALPIGIMVVLVFFTSFFITYLFLPFKKSLLLACLVTAALATNKSRIITIITYAICLPLLFLPSNPKLDHAQPLPEKGH